MIEEYIEEHIRKQLSDYYPEILPDQIIVKFPKASPDYTANKTRDVITTEILSCTLLITDQEKINRLYIYQSLPRKGLILNEETVEQKITRITHTDFLEVYQMKGYLVEIEYKHLIKEG